MAPRTAAAPASSAGCTYSIRAQFSGASVLLTGATGYVGSLVLEALLRLTDVGRVYVLLRPKGGAAPEQRLAQLVQVRERARVRGGPAPAVALRCAAPCSGALAAGARDCSIRIDGYFTVQRRSGRAGSRQGPMQAADSAGRQPAPSAGGNHARAGSSNAIRGALTTPRPLTGQPLPQGPGPAAADGARRGGGGRHQPPRAGPFGPRPRRDPGARPDHPALRGGHPARGAWGQAWGQGSQEGALRSRADRIIQRQCIGLHVARALSLPPSCHVQTDTRNWRAPCRPCEQVDIHTALKSNYLGTKAVLDLARGSAQLRALVHTSSAFVNMNQPRSSVVGERLYPLAYGRRRVAHEEVVQVGGGRGVRNICVCMCVCVWVVCACACWYMFQSATPHSPCPLHRPTGPALPAAPRRRHARARARRALGLPQQLRAQQAPGRAAGRQLPI